MIPFFEQTLNMKRLYGLQNLSYICTVKFSFQVSVQIFRFELLYLGGFFFQTLDFFINSKVEQPILSVK